MSHKREPARLRYPDTGCTAWVAGRCRLDPVAADSALVALTEHAEMQRGRTLTQAEYAAFLVADVGFDELTARRFLSAANEYYEVLLEAHRVE